MENNAERGMYIKNRGEKLKLYRWHNHLDPMVRKVPWNETEEFVFI